MKSKVGSGDREFLQILFSSRALGSGSKFPGNLSVLYCSYVIFSIQRTRIGLSISTKA